MPNISSANSSYIQSQQILKQILPKNPSMMDSNSALTLKTQQKPVNPPIAHQKHNSKGSKVTLILSAILAFGGIFALIKAGKTPAVVDNPKINEQLNQIVQNTSKNTKAISALQNSLDNLKSGLTNSAQKQELDKLTLEIETLRTNLLEAINRRNNNDNIQQGEIAKYIQTLSKMIENLSSTADKMAKNSSNTEDLSKTIRTLQGIVKKMDKDPLTPELTNILTQLKEIAQNKDSITPKLTNILTELQGLVEQLNKNSENIPNFEMKAAQLKSMTQTLSLITQKMESAEQNIASVNAVAKGAAATQAKASETLDKLSSTIDELKNIDTASTQIFVSTPSKTVNSSVVQNASEIEQTDNNAIKKLTDIVFNSGKAFNKTDNSAFSGIIKDVTPSGSPFEMFYDKGILQQAKHNGKTKIYTTTPSKIDGIIQKRVITSYDDLPIKTVFKMTMAADKKDRTNYTTGKFILDDINNFFREIKRFTKTGNKATTYEAVDGIYKDFEKKNLKAQEIVQYNAYTLSQNLFQAEDSQVLNDGSLLSWPKVDRLTAKTSTFSLTGEAIEPQTKEVVSIYKKNKGNRVNVGFKEMG